MPNLHLEGEVLNVSMDKRLNRFVLFLCKKKIIREEKIERLQMDKIETKEEEAERIEKKRISELPESHLAKIYNMA